MTSDRSVLVRRAARRLGCQAAALGCTVVVLLSVVAVLVVVRGERDSAVESLDAAVLRADDIDDPPAWIWLSIRRGDGSRPLTDTDPAMPAGLPDTGALDRVSTGGPGELRQVQLDGVDYLVQTIRQPTGWTVQGVLDLAPSEAARTSLITALLVSGGVGLVLAALIGTWLGSRALRPLSDALAVQRRFVADAGHELRTPVTLLNTRAQLVRRRLAGRGEDPDETGDLDGLVTDSGRLADILDELLLAADPGVERQYQPIELSALAREVVAAATAQAAGRGVQLQGPADADAVQVAGLPVALRRAVTALVDNAVRHAAHEVTVRVGTRGREALLDVVDDGPGIEPELAHSVFDRFVTGRTGSAERRYGIGLALVNEIVGAHGGRVELLPRDEPGAALRIVLPLPRARRTPNPFARTALSSNHVG